MLQSFFFFFNSIHVFVTISMYFVVIFIKFSPVFSFKFSFKIQSFPKKIEFLLTQVFFGKYFHQDTQIAAMTPKQPGHQNINITSSIYAKITFGTPFC